MPNGRFQKTGITSFALVVLVVALSCAPASFAYKPGDFPGVGSYSAWYDAVTVYQAAHNYLDQGTFDAAIDKFNSAISAYPHDSRFFQGLGKAYEERNHPGDIENAEAQYRQATALNADDWGTWYSLATLLYKNGRKHEAKEEYKQALERKPPLNATRSIQRKIDEIEKEPN